MNQGIMHKPVLLFLSFLLFFFTPGYLTAGEKATVKVSSVKQKGEEVHFAVSSTKPFIFGSNQYVLYIGGKEFTRMEQSNGEDKRVMTFVISKAEFRAIKEGAKMYLSYGRVEDTDMEKYAKQSMKCWKLGTFSKKLLKK
jgi:hypothetical protein